VRPFRNGLARNHGNKHIDHPAACPVFESFGGEYGLYYWRLIWLMVAHTLVHFGLGWAVSEQAMRASQK
jgi:hypothetical protein